MPGHAGLQEFYDDATGHALLALPARSTPSGSASSMPPPGCGQHGRVLTVTFADHPPRALQLGQATTYDDHPLGD